MKPTPSTWILVASLPWCWLLPALPAQTGELPEGARVSRRGPDQDKLKQRYEQKRSNPVFTKLPWCFDLATAVQQAQQQHQPILCYFTRSFAACPPCEEFEQEVLATPEFAAVAKDVVPFVHITTHLEGRDGDDLLQRCGGNAWPTVAFLDDKGALLCSVPTPPTLAGITAAETQVQRWQQLRAAVASGQEGEQKALFLLELGMGNRPYAEMQQRLAPLRFEAAERAGIEQQLINLQFVDILRHTALDKLGEAGGKFVAMYRQHRIPDSGQVTSFWQYAFTYAALQGDAALYAEMLATVKQQKSKDPRLLRYLPALEATLAQLQKQKGG